ncbi:MAG TPA: hypothetical protein PKW33_17200 [Anaerolineaceae bacterium]|nr:hypothetical protein [Anaerolineaceae bacterium]HPN53337.1 hypothetical protein [Anaerolineaceae bacterium]
MPPLLTLFTAPKPFTNPHIATIQWNALQSWKQLGDEVQVVAVGEEEGLAEACRETGALHLPQVKRNQLGTPLIDSIFELGRSANQSPLLAYINADILLLPDFTEKVRQALACSKQFLLVGQRWDLEVTERLDFTADWAASLDARLKENGKLHPPAGSDYFVFPRACFTEIPRFAIGRAGWDNWMIYEARRRGWDAIDATPSIRIVHQNHDYSHLPNGQPHYRLPESGENVRLAGGKRTMFTLADVSCALRGGRLEALPFSWPRFWRSMETFPITALRAPLLHQLSFALFHPTKAYWEARVAFSQWRRGIRG